MKIDVVYTWVNGNDENWKRKKLEYSQQKNRNHSKEALSDARYMDNDELKYSLRSLFKFAPWINNIYIISDNQNPEWLDSSCTKVKIVDHKEIFLNHDFLPTFNSFAIEANIHRIPDLSECFLYFNDDMFLGDFCPPEYFFLEDGSPLVFVSDIIARKRKQHLNAELLKNHKRNAYQYAVINCRRLLKYAFGKTIYSTIRHGAIACRKSDFIYLEGIFSKHLALTMSHRFRENSDIMIHYLASMYCMLHGTGKRIYVPSLSSKSQLFNYLIKKIMRFFFCYVHLSANDVSEKFSLIEGNKPFMFCLNQYDDSPYHNLLKVKPFLEKYFPDPCPAEKVTKKNEFYNDDEIPVMVSVN